MSAYLPHDASAQCSSIGICLGEKRRAYLCLNKTGSTAMASSVWLSMTTAAPNCSAGRCSLPSSPVTVFAQHYLVLRSWRAAAVASSWLHSSPTGPIPAKAPSPAAELASKTVVVATAKTPAAPSWDPVVEGGALWQALELQERATSKYSPTVGMFGFVYAKTPPSTGRGGVLECWSAGVLDCWTAGAPECWSAECRGYRRIERRHVYGSLQCYL